MRQKELVWDNCVFEEFSTRVLEALREASRRFGNVLTDEKREFLIEAGSKLFSNMGEVHKYSGWCRLKVAVNDVVECGSVG